MSGSSLTPHNYPRRILLAVAANSPQIVTETLYALAQQTEPAFIPTEVHVITTLRGAEFVRAGLCADQQNELGRLCVDYRLPPPQFTADHIHLITDASGQALDDIRTGSDNTHAADFITRIVQQFTADPNASLHVSLSGGRRTMTYYIGYALSLFGRPQDRLSHVLIEEEFYFNTAFYYPPPTPLWVVRSDGSGFDASTVEVTLAEIPFVRLREGLSDALLTGKARFSAAIQMAQRRFDPVQVEFNWQHTRLTCGGVSVPMSPVQLAFYAWMLQRRVEGRPPVPREDGSEPVFAREYLSTYARLFGDNSGYETASRALAGGMTTAYFDERKSNTHKALRKALGQQTAQAYLLQSYGKRPRTCYGLELAAERVELIGNGV